MHIKFVDTLVFSFLYFFIAGTYFLGSVLKDDEILMFTDFICVIVEVIKIICGLQICVVTKLLEIIHELQIIKTTNKYRKL